MGGSLFHGGTEEGFLIELDQFWLNLTVINLNDGDGSDPFKLRLGMLNCSVEVGLETSFIVVAECTSEDFGFSFMDMTVTKFEHYGYEQTVGLNASNTYSHSHFSTFLPDGYTYTSDDFYVASTLIIDDTKLYDAGG